MTESRQEREYQRDRGPDALDRQKKAAVDYWVCCGERRVGPHHEMCVNWKPTVHAGQESLL